MLPAICAIFIYSQSKNNLSMQRQILAAILLFSGLSTYGQTSKIAGFSDSAAATEWKQEKMLDSLVSREQIGLYIKDMAGHPHHLGSAAGKAVAEKIRQQFSSFGFETRMDVYQVLFPTPAKRVLEMTSPSVFHALLKEPALKEDATSGQDGQLPTYNAWSADGNVTAPLVYVNYGLPDDYELLARMGIDVKGKIVIARYGHSWRGTKPKVAQEHGATGCIIYADPADDGYGAGDVYPKGPYKNEFGVQRGSVMDMVIYPGDPLTPGVGAVTDAKRIPSHKDAPNLLKIPVLPISYHDARPLLQSLTGPVAPAGWRGGLPFTYHVGPGRSTVHLELAFDWKMVPCYDVVATIRGSRYPDQWVVRGNHHDAWVNGADDPVSGQASMLEEARALGELIKKGWKPQRTIMYCAWDGEEPGLIGSTEWVEAHASELQEKAVVYINTDAYGRGFFNAGGSQALEGYVNEIAGAVADPETGVSVAERAKANEITDAPSENSAREAMDKKSITLAALGSGSDFSPFLQHLGVPSLNFGFGGQDGGGEYHSIYDSYDNFIRFKDPGFHYGAAEARIGARLVMRMSEARLLPFDFSTLIQNVKTYSEELESLVKTKQQKSKLQKEMLQKNYYGLANDTMHSLLPPVAEKEVPFLDFAPLQNAVAGLDKAVAHAGKVWAAADSSGIIPEGLNARLYRAEQQLLLEKGLPKRDWYRHVLYAPGMYTGYGVKTMPAIREAIEQSEYKEAEAAIRDMAQAIGKMSAWLNAL